MRHGSEEGAAHVHPFNLAHVPLAHVPVERLGVIEHGLRQERPWKRQRRALTAEELRALAGALRGSEPEAKPAARAPAKPTGSKPPRPASSSTSSSGPPGKALTEQELEAQLGDDTYMRALMAKKDAKRAKNVPSANAPPAGGGGVAAHMELTLHKPEKSSVVGVQCEPAPGGEGVLIVAMSQKARGR